MAKTEPRYIFITGGVVSSLGKGLASAALGALLQARGYKAPISTVKFTSRMTAQKLTLIWAIMSALRACPLRRLIISRRAVFIPIL